MNNYLGCNIEYKETSDNGESCELIFRSETEGIATTYANLFRRSLLQNVPCMSVAGLKCYCSGKFIINFFDVVPNISSSLLDISSKLVNAKFNTYDYDEPFVIKSIVSGNVKISDILSGMEVVVGDIEKLDLTSKDELLTTIVGGSSIELSLFFNNGVGYSPKDKNKQDLSNIISQSELDKWIVMDSQHHSILTVSYKPSMVLGMQEIVLGIVNSSGQVKEIIRGCKDNILKQLQFEL